MKMLPSKSGYIQLLIHDFRSYLFYILLEQTCKVQNFLPLSPQVPDRAVFRYVCMCVFLSVESFFKPVSNRRDEQMLLGGCDLQLIFSLGRWR